MRGVKRLETYRINCPSYELSGLVSHHPEDAESCSGWNLKNLTPMVVPFCSHMGLSANALAGFWIKALSWQVQAGMFLITPGKLWKTFSGGQMSKLYRRKNKAVDYTYRIRSPT
jgi:hypothetical protein